MKRMLASSLLFMLLGCGSDDKQLSMNGEALHNEYCADCHKQSGKGNFLAGIPASVTTELNSEQVVQLITQGSAAHKKMPLDQARAIAEHLKTLKP